MKFRTFTQFALFTVFALAFFGCSKDEPNTTETPTPVPGGGTVSGVFINNEESTADSFLISDVSGRYTSLGGFSYLTSTDAVEILFFFPDVNDTGSFSLPYSIHNNLRIMGAGDTIVPYTEVFNVHITLFEQFSNYTLISGTFKILAITLEPNGYYVEVQNGQFSNIPITEVDPDYNKVIYQGEETGLTASKSLIMDYIFFSRFEFGDEYIYTTSYGLSSFDISHSAMSFDYLNSQIVITDQNQAENTVSGRIKTTEEVDLDLNFKDLPYMNFPELDEEQMALVFNFGEEIMYFDSAKYIVAELSFFSDQIEAYKDGSISISISILFDHQGVDVEQGHTVMANNSLTFLPDEVDMYSFINLSPDSTTTNFEFGSMMGGMPGYNQVCIKGKNIPVEM